MDSSFTYDDLLDAIALVEEIPLPPAGIVVSRQSLLVLREMTAEITYRHLRYDHFSGIQIFGVLDCPDAEAVVFKTSDVLAEYWVLQGRIGHAATLQRMSAYVDDGLIRIATLRSLLEVS